MPFSIRDANPAPLAVTRRPRLRGVQDIAQIQLHATRGPVSMELQVMATEHWFASPANDHGTWGASADFVIGPDVREHGEIAIVRFGDWIETFSSWSAGFGARGAGTIGASTRGVAIEIAQPDDETDFTAETIEGLVWLCERINAEIVAAGGVAIPPRHIDSWDQRAGEAVPRGYIGHDELANGVALGKSDPGDRFPWDGFIARMAAATSELETSDGTSGGGEPVSVLSALALRASSLFSYYGAFGRDLPSIAVRGRFFELAGLGDADRYHGSAAQNERLLAHLKSRGVAPVTVAAFQSAGARLRR